jgi:hypothetical protein
MSIALRCLQLVVCFSPLLMASVMGQDPAPQKLALSAALVLTPEFCATVSKKKPGKFPVGKSACEQLGPALAGIFTSLKPVDDSSKAGDARVVLEPKFADVGATRRAFAFSDRELDVLVEWTARNQSGKVVWLETVEGTAKRHQGNTFTHRSNLKHIVEDSVRNMSEQSAAKMAASPQLRKLSAQPLK